LAHSEISDFLLAVDEIISLNQKVICYIDFLCAMRSAGWNRFIATDAINGVDFIVSAPFEPLRRIPD